MQGIVKIPFFSSFYVIALVSHEKENYTKSTKILQRTFYFIIILINVLLNFGKQILNFETAMSEVLLGLSVG